MLQKGTGLSGFCGQTCSFLQHSVFLYQPVTAGEDV